jgi:hypothetical protein
MSDTFAPAPDAEPLVGSTDSSEEVTTTEKQYLDPTEYSNYRVPVKLNGEEQDVSFAEAVAGYQRQADYTQKTQELAEQRQALQFASTLQTALENDPAGTLNLLRNHYGISEAQAQEMVDSYDEDADPRDIQMAQLDKRLAQFEEQQSQQQIEKEISRLSTKYEDFDTNQVVQAAIRSGSTDLEATYKQLAFDVIMNQRELQSQASAQTQLRESEVVQAKRDAGVISGGSSATASTTNDSSTSINTLAEAFAAAKRQLLAN